MDIVMSESSTESTLRRGVDLLLVLSSEEALTGDGLGVTRAAELLHLDKSLVSRTLKTLESMGVVERDQKSRHYRLGWRLYAIATRAGNQRLLDAARPVLRDLVTATGESAYLTVRDKKQVLTLLAEETARLVQATEKAGTYAALHCTSSGRALLMDSSLADLHAIFASERLQAPTPYAPGSVSELMSRIQDSRSRGYAAARDELEVGLSALAVPVRIGGQIVAAINVSSPTYRLSERADLVGQQLIAAAVRLEQQLGG
jgi:DNA-binding IclR family transcriptional regulator